MQRFLIRENRLLYSPDTQNIAANAKGSGSRPSCQFLSVSGAPQADRDVLEREQRTDEKCDGHRYV